MFFDSRKKILLCGVSILLIGVYTTLISDLFSTKPFALSLKYGFVAIASVLMMIVAIYNITYFISQLKQLKLFFSSQTTQPKRSVLSFIFIPVWIIFSFIVEIYYDKGFDVSGLIWVLIPCLVGVVLYSFPVIWICGLGFWQIFQYNIYDSNQMQFVPRELIVFGILLITMIFIYHKLISKFDKNLQSTSLIQTIYDIIIFLVACSIIFFIIGFSHIP